jgi:hypothetical protein
MYQAQQPGPADPTNGATTDTGPDATDDDVKDVDFEVVEDDDKS